MRWYIEEKATSGTLSGELVFCIRSSHTDKFRWFARVKHPIMKQVYSGKLQPVKVVDKVEELELFNSPEAKKVLEELQYKELCLIAKFAIDETKESES